MSERHQMLALAIFLTALAIDATATLIVRFATGSRITALIVFSPMITIALLLVVGGIAWLWKEALSA